MQKILFIDRDGTLIVEPPTDFQVDSYEKLAFLPGVMRHLHRIVASGQYRLVMVTNQDGLGTESFPEETFWPAHRKMLDILESEGIRFDEILIDRTFEHEQAPTRKPRTGLLTHYLNNPAIDLANSFVIGDRITDIELAKNLGAQGILIGQAQAPEGEVLPIALRTDSWEGIANFLLTSKPQRSAEIRRETKETKIHIRLQLDGQGRYSNDTGIGFLDHMLDQLAMHAGLNLEVLAQGDLHIDHHHTIEDTAIALGQAFAQALGDKRGMERYGFFNLVMDETLAQVAIDFSGRASLVWDVQLRREAVGGFPCEMVSHFFKSFADQVPCNLHIRCSGENDHHQIEAIFKSFAKSIKMAKQITGTALPSTKGML
ncbi:bifunctional histidinol-phosphatase/imidazoleglycerol-phosphate dehydratase HisB [Eisenibacter elegans]|uniref:bifunctional histidinol-phosphatase/imidazoleglycerol-phosphate dehydratase HisB n=1 Tax=Eisenibacter elegans TaxID=997 RepID=UPI000479CA40|nr:bifunctional histidinol-phosphatase/imidazoleglycerol-phosphate dehydratase HisB [Eisenibacter elegans]